MILDAAQTVLGFFCFDRSAYSNFKRNKGRKNKRYRNGDALMLKEIIFVYVFILKSLKTELFSRVFRC
jgi:hypothetical protein